MRSEQSPKDGVIAAKGRLYLGLGRYMIPYPAVPDEDGGGRKRPAGG